MRSVASHVDGVWSIVSTIVHRLSQALNEVQHEIHHTKTLRTVYYTTASYYTHPECVQHVLAAISNAALAWCTTH